MDSAGPGEDLDGGAVDEVELLLDQKEDLDRGVVDEAEPLLGSKEDLDRGAADEMELLLDPKEKNLDRGVADEAEPLLDPKEENLDCGAADEAEPLLCPKEGLDRGAADEVESLLDQEEEKRSEEKRKLAEVMEEGKENVKEVVEGNVRDVKNVKEDKQNVEEGKEDVITKEDTLKRLEENVEKQKMIKKDNMNVKEQKDKHKEREEIIKIEKENVKDKENVKEGKETLKTDKENIKEGKENIKDKENVKGGKENVKDKQNVKEGQENVKTDKETVSDEREVQRQTVRITDKLTDKRTDKIIISKELHHTLVPDGGWGWFVALGGFIITMLLSSLGPCFGILFSRFLLEREASSVLVAWIFNVQLLIWHLMGPLVRPLSNEFGWRGVGFFGVLMCSSSIIISAFSPSAEFLFFSFSLLSGIGGGLVVSMCYIIVPQYFDRRRGKANAIMMIGLCMGQILLAPFVRYLQDQEGFLGSTLIFGAVMLNGCVGVFFFHPVQWHMKRVTLDGDQVETPPEETTEESQKPLVSFREDVLQNGNRVSKRGSRKRELQNYDQNKTLKLTSDLYSDNVTGSLESAGKECVALMERNHPSPIKFDDPLPRQSNKGIVKIFRILNRVARSTIRDLQILQQRRALIIAFGNMLCMNAYFNFVMMVPFAVQAMDFTLQDSAWCITVMGIFNLISRIVISILSDWKWFNMRICCMIGYAVIATVMFVFPLMKVVTWLVVLMGVFGCGLAATISLLHLVMIQYMGVENLAPMFGSTCLLIGIGFPTFGPLIGFIRDCSGSYRVSMWVLSAMMFTSFVLWLFMPAAVSFDDRRTRSKKIPEDVEC